MGQTKNKVTAAMLAFFTGFIGGHKLYLNKIGGFIGFIFLFWISMRINFPLSVIIGVIQGVKLLKMSDMEFDKKFNRGFIPIRRGPLEARREEQMRKYEQIPNDNRKKAPSSYGQKPSPLASMKSNPYKASGIKKYKDFDLEDAILDFKKGLELTPTDVALHFNLACAYSLTEKKYLSYHHLSLAVGNGLKDVEKIMSHDDLAFVRIQPEFSEFKANGFRINPFKSDKVPSGQEGTQPDEEKDESLLSQLNHLAELKSRGLLSDIEFNTERKKILKQ